MPATKMTKAVIESIVMGNIRKIAEDPERSIRNLADMCAIAAKGKPQWGVLERVEAFLEEDSGAYREMIRRTVRQTDARRLARFGVNVGWQSWTRGGDQIRRIKAQEGYNIPWALLFHMAGARPEEGADFAGLVAQGKELGIYVYFLHTEGDDAAFDAAFDLARREPECAFVILCGPELICRRADGPEAPENTMTAVETAPGWREAVSLLREERQLYSLWRSYRTAEDVADITGGGWADRLKGDCGAISICIADRRCPEALRQQVGRYVKETRRLPDGPFLMMDLYQDILGMGEVISEDPVFLDVCPDGGATGYTREGEKHAAIGSDVCALRQLLRREYPRT